MAARIDESAAACDLRDTCSHPATTNPILLPYNSRNQVSVAVRIRKSLKVIVTISRTQSLSIPLYLSEAERFLGYQNVELLLHYVADDAFSCTLLVEIFKPEAQ